MKNKDFVAFHPALDTAWIFEITASAPTVHERFNETTNVLRQLAEALKPILQPTGIEYVLFEADRDTATSTLDREDLTTPRTERVDAEEGLSPETLATVLREEQVGNEVVPWLTRLEIDRCRVKVTLASGDRFIDETTEQYGAVDDEGDTARPTKPPLTVTLFHVGMGDEPTPKFEIVVRSYTDIWFEPTDVGVRNRERLGRVLSTIHDRLPVTGAKFDSDRYSVEWLERQGFSELVLES